MQCNQIRKCNNNIWIGKEEMKPSLFTNTMTSYRENPKNIQRISKNSHNNLIGQFRMTGIQKMHFYILATKMEPEIFKVSFMIALKTIK